jgi:hypothetical protein
LISVRGYFRFSSIFVPSPVDPSLIAKLSQKVKQVGGAPRRHCAERHKTPIVCAKMRRAATLLPIAAMAR